MCLSFLRKTSIVLLSATMLMATACNKEIEVKYDYNVNDYVQLGKNEDIAVTVDKTSIENQIVDDKTDECSIYAVLYEEVLDDEGNNIALTGDYKNKEVYIGSSSRIVMRATLENGGEVNDWTEFTASFKLLENKTYDPSKKYYLAVVCASSAEGDYYQGAPGSTLIVDNLKVTSK